MNGKHSGLLLLMAGLLAACGGNTTTPGSPSGGPSGSDTLKPGVTILTPDSSNPLLPLPLTISGKLSDNVSVMRTLLVIDNGPAQQIAFRPGAATEFSVTLSGLSAGQHTARINAYDDSNNLGYADVRFQVSATGDGGTGGGGGGGGGTGGGGSGGGSGADTTAPSLTVTAPLAGSTLGSSFSVLGSVSDNRAGVTVRAVLDGGAAQSQSFGGSGGAFSLPFSAVAAGNHTLVVTATDSSGLTTTRSISFTGSGSGNNDTSQPLLNLTSPTAGASLTNPVLISGSASDNALAQVTYAVDGGAPQSVAVTDGLFNASVILPAGAHSITVTASDTSGNSSSQTVNVTVTNGGGGDTQGPSLTLSSPQPGNASLPLTISGTVSDPSGVGSVTYSVDGGSAQNIAVSGGSFSTTVSSLPAGSHSITVTATDSAGNSSSQSVTVTVTNGGNDTTSPTLNLNQPLDNQVVLGSVAISGSASDMGGLKSVSYRIDGGAEQQLSLSGGAFATTASGLTPGSHTVTVTASDTSGNLSTRSVTVQSVSALVNGGSGSYSVSSGTSGVCLLCAVSSPGNVVDASLSNYAVLTNAVGALGGTYVQVQGPQVAAGRTVGFAVSAPSGDLLSLGVLSGLTVRTYLNGSLQESGSAATLLDLSALGLLGSGDPTLRGLQFVTSKPFDTVRLDNAAAVGVLSSLRVYFAYVQ